MLVTKIRTTVAALVTVACVSAVGVTGVASATVVSPVTALSTQSTANPQIAPTTIARLPNPKDAGSAGIPGYDDRACEDLLDGYNQIVSGAATSATPAHDFKAAEATYQVLTDNCLVTY
jgi:hypothetical protein